ncbi:MAG: adenylate/guanylate cyclase domain-containing protein [Planctomycetes bacterium]|nr:adenylate/guanylate cyclase domain-containing protein [Planctomycetota bacterium]
MAELLAEGPLPGQQLWIPLPVGTVVRIGRAVQKGWSVYWDNMISREHADLLLEGDRLKVTCLETARNPACFNGVERTNFQLSIGEDFQIGETLFRLIDSRNLDSDDSNEVHDATFEFKSFAKDELRNYKFHNADERLDVLSRLPELIAQAGSHTDFAKRLAGLLLEAIPNAGTAAVIVAKQDDNLPDDKKFLIDFQRKRAGTTLSIIPEESDETASQFRPSYRLIRAALETGESQLHIWTDQDGSSNAYTLMGDFNWAFCIPIQAEACKNWCLYVAGLLKETVSLSNNLSSDALRGDLRLAELMGQIMGSILQIRLLEEQQARMTQFFSPKVAQTLIGRGSEEELVPREDEFTVLFCDLRGFSRKSEKEQHDLIALLNRVGEALGVMTRRIIEHDGVIADFQGDAALGFWGWPIAPDDGPLAACRTALAISQEFVSAAKDKSTSLADFRVGIGLAHGTAVAGKIGTKDQAKLGVFGPVVNLASRLEGMTKQLRVSILIDETIADYIRNKMSPSEGRCRRLGRIRPYGMQTVLTVSELLPPVHQDAKVSDENIADYEQALDFFIEGRWTETLEKLDRLPVGERVKDFLMIFIAQNNYEPPSGWDGVISMPRK